MYPNSKFPPIKIAEIRVCRTSRSDEDIGDYTYGIDFKRDGISDKFIEGKVEGFERRLGATQLIKTILDQENVIYNPTVGTCYEELS